MTSERLQLALFLLTFIIVANQACAESLTAKQALDALKVDSSVIEKIENGEVVSFSGEPYEQSKREVASDAAMIVNTTLDYVLAEINELASLIPDEVILAFQDIESNNDFSQIGFDSSKDLDLAEVEKLYKLKKGKDYNLTSEEYEILIANLDRGRGGSPTEKAEAASRAIQDLLLARYRDYREQGLAGIQPYQRSGKSVDIGKELKVTTQTLDIVREHLPGYYDNLMRYPAGAECCQHKFHSVTLPAIPRKPILWNNLPIPLQIIT